MWWIIALAVVVLLGLILTGLLDRPAQIQGHPEPDRSAQPGHARRNLSGMMVIRAFNMQSFEENVLTRPIRISPAPCYSSIGSWW